MNKLIGSIVIASIAALAIAGVGLIHRSADVTHANSPGLASAAEYEGPDDTFGGPSTRPIGALSVTSAGSALMAPTEAQAIQAKTLRFDVAEDFTRFSADETPVHEDGLPAYGNEFVTQGYIYPHGTLQCDENGCNGVLPDGSPEFPGLVMGEWSCWGYHVGDGAHTTTGPIVVTTQLYDLGEVPGGTTLVTEGYELIDFNVAVQRAITGGTGQYRNARGEVAQQLLGFNQTHGVDLRFEVDLN